MSFSTILSCCIWSWLSSMLWALRVLDLLLDLDLEHLPLGLWCLSLCSCVRMVFYCCCLCGSFVSTYNNCWNDFLCPHLWHFLPNAGHSLSGCNVLHLLHALPELPFALWLLPVLPFLYLKVLISSTVDAITVPPLDLCLLKSFTVILCSFVCWRSDSYVTSSLFFFDLTHFLTSKCLVTWKSNSVLHTNFSASVLYWHLSTRFLIQLVQLICWLMLSLSDVTIHLVNVVPVRSRYF